MNRKRIIISSIVVFLAAGLIVGYYFWANQRADYYANVSRETNDKQAKILALEKSVTLLSKPNNVVALADLYVSIGRNDLAEKIMVGRGEVLILNRLGSLYLDENKTSDAENAFTKAKNKKSNSDSLKGLILVQLKKGDRGVAENYLTQLNPLDSNSGNCNASFVYLNDFKTAENFFAEAKNCELYGLDKYFRDHKAIQNPTFLKLEAVNIYYQNNYLTLALSDILALEKEKSNYRDAFVLGSNIYEKLGDQGKANEQKKRADQIDPLLRFKD